MVLVLESISLLGMLDVVDKVDVVDTNEAGLDVLKLASVVEVEGGVGISEDVFQVVDGVEFDLDAWPTFPPLLWIDSNLQSIEYFLDL